MTRRVSATIALLRRLQASSRFGGMVVTCSHSWSRLASWPIGYSAGRRNNYRVRRVADASSATILDLHAEGLQDSVEPFHEEPSMVQYKLTRVDEPPLPGVHGGTGDINSAKNVVFWGSVNADVKAQLVFTFERYRVTVMSFRAEGIGTPDWFGVCFRQGLGAFDSVNIMCHPSPGNAGMVDGDYENRGGKWPSLFRYAEMLGSQIAIAGNNQIVIVPFFNNAAYTSTGGFGLNWKQIITDILNEVRTEARKMSEVNDSVALRDVVLSDFSFGRQLMRNIRAHSPGLGNYLREVWDFDGVGPGTPYSSGSVKGILYDQQAVVDPRSYHVPPQRWLGFHHRVVPSVHSNIPDMLGVHAARMSGVGN